MDADNYGAGLHVARADHEHGVNLRLLGALILAVALVGPEIASGPDHVRAEFLNDGPGVIRQRFIVADCKDTDLFGREPKREIAIPILDKEVDGLTYCFRAIQNTSGKLGSQSRPTRPFSRMCRSPSGEVRLGTNREPRIAPARLPHGTPLKPAPPVTLAGSTTATRLSLAGNHANRSGFCGLAKGTT